LEGKVYGIRKTALWFETKPLAGLKFEFKLETAFK